MKRILIKASAFTLLLCGMCACQVPKEPSQSLAGEWYFALDSNDVGDRENWAAQPLKGRVKLPGSLQEQGKGFDVSINTPWTGHVADRSWYDAPEYEKYRQPGNMKVPFWLNPDKHYVGVAWYQREIEIPTAWEGKRVLFEFERTHWETTLYLDGKQIGHQNALQVPHRYIVELLEPGKHLLSLKVDNRMHIDVGSNAHSISDHTQSNWNGVVGEITMKALPALAIEHVQVYPNAKERKANVKVYLDGKVKEDAFLTFDVRFSGSSVVKKKMGVGADAGDCIETTLEWDDEVKLWSEFTPNVYDLNVVLTSSDGVSTKNTNFGFRELKVNGTHFDINGHPLFLRGTLECCVFPLTGYPSMDTEYWEKIYRTCKEYGLNHVRFHSWCPPEAAFDAADELGVYLQVECGGWTCVGDGNSQDEWFIKESDRIVKEYGNHPSFCLLAYGNEPSGGNQGTYLNNLMRHWKQTDGRRLYTSAAGWPQVPDADYFNTDRPRIGGIGRIQNILNTYIPRTDYDFRESILKDLPVVSHEVGQWCVYPDFKEIDKYTGVLKAKNFEIFRETLNEKGLGDMAEKFLYASGRLQTLCYKMDIEAALRTPGFAGFQLLDLHDFPGQGTALVGVLNPFWESKGYVDDKEFSAFCNQTVPLARMSKLVWLNNEKFKADIEFAHFGGNPIEDATILWHLEKPNGEEVGEGFFNTNLPIGNGIKVGSVDLPLNGFSEATQLTLKINVEGTPIANSWNIWVYPAEKKDVEDMPLITHNVDEAVKGLNAGGKVLLLSYGHVSPKKGGDIRTAFTPIFWNTAWTNNAPPTTLGFLCDPAHPAFASFPNNGYSDFQWKDLAVNCEAMVMDDFPHEFRPLVYIIDDWFKNRKLGMLFEGKVGKGKLMVCSADLETDLANRPSVAQFRQSLLEYMASDKFNPQSEVDVQALRGIFKK